MKSAKGIIAAALVGCAFVVWVLGGRSVAAEAVYPVENGYNWFTRHVTRRLSAFFARGSLLEENRRLKREIDALQMVREDADRAVAENVRLRALLDNPAGLTTNGWICASVLSRDGAAGCQGLLRVGKGSQNGIRKGAAVAVPDGLVGRVSEVSPHTAVIRLITDPDIRVACEVETNDPGVGTIYGILYGGRTRVVSAEAEASLLYVVNPFRLRHLKRDFALPSRARIITSGLGGVYPRGLTVGFLIDGPQEDGTQLEQAGDVLPAVDFPALEDVFIRRE